MEAYRLIKRTKPYTSESVFGFLMRAAAANHYHSHQQILQYAIDAGPNKQTVELAQISRLGTYMRNSVGELAQLSGITRHVSCKGNEWKVLGEWLSKTSFINARSAPVCPQCLREACFLRGEWHLSFNVSCWKHKCALIDRCPECKQKLLLSRRHPAFCDCMFDLRHSVTSVDEPEALLVASLFCNRTYGSLNYDSTAMPDIQIENLAGLTLDGLCHTLWFLGHHLNSNFSLTRGSALRKLTFQETREMISHVCWLLSDWPARLEQALTKKIALRHRWAGNSSTVRLLGPVQRYFDTHIEPSALKFIVIPYEIYMRRLVKSAGVRLPRVDTRQLELDLI